MKILDRYILKTFLVPFFATFFIILFVLVMQALWLAFESIAGKGIGLFFILKFLYYTALVVSTQALPIAILLSSIMAMGNLSENYELAAIKSASVSLMRLMRPLIILTFLISIINFLNLNYILPYATLKQKNLTSNIKKKTPALALIPGSFNTDIPNYQIKFDEKYGEDQNLLKNVLIYDLSSKKGNKKIISSKKGKILNEEGSKYMTLVLYDGFYHEEHIQKKITMDNRTKMPASNASFKEYAFNIDISKFNNDDLDDEKFTKNFNMLSLNQLNDTVPFMKNSYDEYVFSKAKSIFVKIYAKELYGKSDTIDRFKLSPVILDNFDLKGKISVLNEAINKTKVTAKNIKNDTESLRWRRKKLNLYDIEFHYRIAFSLSCLILFFIGAPLGSIIRKGGFGLPMILAISVYVIYFFINMFGRNLAEESSLSAIEGSWISSIIMIPIAYIITLRATKGRTTFDISILYQPFIKLINKTKSS